MFSNRTLHWSLPPLWLGDIQDLIRQIANNAGAHLPPASTLGHTQAASVPALPVRPALLPSSGSSSSGRWRPSWGKGSGSVSPLASSPPPMFSAMPPPIPRPAQSPVTSPVRGSSFDWNQAMGLTQSALDAYNNVQGQGGSAFGGVGYNSNSVNDRLELVNNLASNGMMVGQLAGQFAGAAAVCCMM